MERLLVKETTEPPMVDTPVTTETMEETGAGTLTMAVTEDTAPLRELTAPTTKEEAGAGASAAADDAAPFSALVAPDTAEAATPDAPVTADTIEEAPLATPETAEATPGSRPEEGEAEEDPPVAAAVDEQMPLFSTPRQTVADTGRRPGFTAAETPTPPGRMLPSKPALDVAAAAPPAEVGVQMPLLRIPRQIVAETGRMPGLTAAETPTPPERMPPSKPALDVAEGAAEAGAVPAAAAAVGVQTPRLTTPRHTFAETPRPERAPPSRPAFEVAAGAAGAGVEAAFAAAADVGVQMPLFKMPKQTVAETPRTPGLTAAETPTPPGRTLPGTPPRRPPLLAAAACVVATGAAAGAAAAVDEPPAAPPTPVAYS